MKSATHINYASNTPDAVRQIFTERNICDLIAASQKIGEGKYREAFNFADKFCVKRLKSVRTKSVAGLNITIPLRAYQAMSFGHEDLNEYEFRQSAELQKTLPPQVKAYFTRIYATLKTHGCSYSIGDLISDFDGGVSKTLDETGTIPSNSQFWDQLFYVRDELLGQQTPHFGVQAANIAVQRTGTNTQRPVFIDLKRVDPRRYMFQPWNWGIGAQMHKMEVQFDRIAQKHRYNC